MKTLNLIALAVMLALTPACVINHGDYTVLSSKLVDTKDFDLSKAERARGVVGEDYVEIIIFFPFGKLNPTVEGALDAALSQHGGDLMTDVTLEYFSWYIPLIYGREGWRVKGDVVRTRER